MDHLVTEYLTVQNISAFHISACNNRHILKKCCHDIPARFQPSLTVTVHPSADDDIPAGFQQGIFHKAVDLNVTGRLNDHVLPHGTGHMYRAVKRDIAVSVSHIALKLQVLDHHQLTVL